MLTMYWRLFLRMMLLGLLFGNSAKCSITQEERLATSLNWWKGSTCRARLKWGSTCEKQALSSSHQKRQAQIWVRSTANHVSFYRWVCHSHPWVQNSQRSGAQNGRCIFSIWTIDLHCMVLLPRSFEISCHFMIMGTDADISNIEQFRRLARRL